MSQVSWSRGSLLQQNISRIMIVVGKSEKVRSSAASVTDKHMHGPECDPVPGVFQNAAVCVAVDM